MKRSGTFIMPSNKYNSALVIFRIKYSKWWHLYALEWICLFLGDKTQKTYLNKTSIYAFALFIGTEINLLCSAFDAFISTWLFYIFQWLASKRGVLWSILIHDHSTNLSKFWTSFEEMLKISYILEMCIPCSTSSFKRVYKILAINFQSGHKLHRCLESE